MIPFLHNNTLQFLRNVTALRRKSCSFLHQRYMKAEMRQKSKESSCGAQAQSTDATPRPLHRPVTPSERSGELICVQVRALMWSLTDVKKNTHTRTASKLTSVPVQTAHESPFEVLFKDIFYLKVDWFRHLNGYDGSS